MATATHMTTIRSFAAVAGLAVLALGCSADNATYGVIQDGHAQGGTDGWSHPMTPWGDPDLQGMWPVTHMTLTPLERPPQFGTRAWLTDEEFEQRAASIAARNERYDREISADSMGQGHWAEAGQVPQRQASLIFDPPNGRLPPLTPAGRAKSSTMRSSWMDITWDSTEDFDSWDRCITRGMPASMFPMQYNNGIQIIQAPGYVVINLEMIHEARIIPVDGRPALDSDIRQWMGESRGHWEGNTLVIETTNFNGRTPMTSVVTPGAPRRNDVPTSESMRIVERLTRTSHDTIDYEITTYDPEMMESSWTASYPWQLDPDYEFFEYACHEGNTAIRYYIETSRYERANARQRR